MIIKDLIGAGNVSISVTAADLKEFALAIINEVETRKAAEEQQREKKCETMSAREVIDRLNVTAGTLWRWAKSGYLVPRKVGRRNVYLVTDVENLGKGK